MENSITLITKSLGDVLPRKKYVKSPLNYIGGKHKLLDQILPLFPRDINCFIDLFAGGCNVGANVEARKIICNDNLRYLVDLYAEMQKTPVEDILIHIEQRIQQYKLTQTNDLGYKALRDLYNEERNPLDLFVLVAYSFNHQIRFNNSHYFNNPFGRSRSSFNDTMRQNLISFVERIHRLPISFTSFDFEEINLSSLQEDDFVYCDPPYLITTGTYNDGKRGFKGWGEKEETILLSILDNLNRCGVKFALSNVIAHKGRKNDILKQWIEGNNYHVTILKANYANSSYNTFDRGANSSIEVLITNYTPSIAIQKTLF